VVDDEPDVEVLFVDGAVFPAVLRCGRDAARSMNTRACSMIA